MALEMGLWRADGNKLDRIKPTAIGLESQLEAYIESDPAILGVSLLVVGRQVATAHGGYIDLLAVDETGTVHVLELKRDKTPRDVTAQALDYGSWVSALSHSDIVAIWNAYKPHQPFEVAFAEAFGGAPPEDLNASQVFTIVAASVDAATERIVRFLNEGYGIPINVVFFRHFEDGGNRYLARTWLVDHEVQSTKSGSAGKQVKSKEPWNGQDWYCSFGDDGTSRNWDDAVEYGFVSAGGQSWYSRTLKNLPVGGRVFACIPGSGYVGVGTVTGAAVRFDQLNVDTDNGPVR
ncbi:endonuclease NucS domain-containing protein [Nocardioides daphniae]|uniref:endonuclease NucS domain-containing protein n=1 Tax=Nocardioides daphniae TaxID=402297 RepID=UPI001930EAAE|nr:endonuclease NucS domain-containing protein [Nocardioides daphniae]